MSHYKAESQPSPYIHGKKINSYQLRKIYSLYTMYLLEIDLGKPTASYSL